MLQTNLMTTTRLIILLLFFSVFSHSQNHIYKHFGVDEGLPSSEVYDIYQDREGYMWFATDKGLSRYNGYEFENFTTKNGLPDNTILDFYPQPNGQIWCFGYHSRKLFYFDEVFNGFKNYEYNDLIAKQTNDPRMVVKSLVINSDGTLYLGGYSLEGYIKITAQGELTRHYPLNTMKVATDANLAIKTDSDFFFLLYSNYKSDSNFQYVDLKHSPTARIDYSRLNDSLAVIIDKKLGLLSNDGTITYYETEQYPTGIRRIDETSFFVGYYSNGGEIRSIDGTILDTYLPNKSVSSFFIDNEGSHWFSTVDDGVFYIKNPNIKVKSEQHITSLTKDDHETLYAGLINGDIARVSKNKIDVLHRGLQQDDAIVQFNPLNKQLYGYSDAKLFNYTSKQASQHITASKLPEFIGTPLISSVSNYFFIHENDSIVAYFSDYKIQDICQFNDTILVGTSSGLFVKKNDSIVKHQTASFLKSRIDDIDVSTNTQTVYMATQGHGIVVYNDNPYTISKSEGLTNDIISEIHIENDSTIWACSNTGLNRVVFKSDNTYKVNTITKADGLISNDIDDVEIVKDTVWVATKKGLCYFNKSFLKDKDASQIVSLKLEQATANKKAITNNRKLKYNENSLNFKLQAISHRNTEKIEYLYRLKEIDTNWTVTKKRTISFPSLSPGNYTFQAKAKVFNNTKDTLVHYAFKILPPFWKSWWFYSICTLLFLGIIYLFFKIRVLTYNKDIFRELIRLAIKRLKRKEQFYNFRSNGEDFKIATHEIQYINSQGNYLDIITSQKKYTIRCKIGDFISTTPDGLEYLRVHRSYIIRIDQVSSKGKNWVVINDHKIPVGETYLKQLDKIHF